MTERSDLMNSATEMSLHINEAYDMGIIDKKMKMRLHDNLDEIVYTIEKAYE